MLCMISSQYMTGQVWNATSVNTSATSRWWQQHPGPAREPPALKWARSLNREIAGSTRGSLVTLPSADTVRQAVAPETFQG